MLKNFHVFRLRSAFNHFLSIAVPCSTWPFQDDLPTENWDVPAPRLYTWGKVHWISTGKWRSSDQHPRSSTVPAKSPSWRVDSSTSGRTCFNLLYSLNTYIHTHTYIYIYICVIYWFAASKGSNVANPINHHPQVTTIPSPAGSGFEGRLLSAGLPLRQRGRVSAGALEKWVGGRRTGAVGSWQVAGGKFADFEGLRWKTIDLNSGIWELWFVGE